MKVQFVGYKELKSGGYRMFFLKPISDGTGLEPVCYKTSEKYGVCFPKWKTKPSYIVGETYDIPTDNFGKLVEGEG